MNQDKALKYDLLVITGPTASGKTSLAAVLALKLNGEIISADSRQVYRQMNLGTGKDYKDYLVRGNRIPYHLIDIVDPGYKYNVFEYQQDFVKVLNNLRSKRVFPIVCGGSGMYIDSIVSAYKMIAVPPDPGLRHFLEGKSMEELVEILATYKELHNKSDIDTKKRAIRAIEIEYYSKPVRERKVEFPAIKPLIMGVLYTREKRRERISERLKKRFDEGMENEVRQLLNQGLKPEELMYYGLEYKYITLYITGKLTFNEMYSSLETAIYRFAKRQMTWFRGMERRGVKIHWIDGELPIKEKADRVMSLLF